MPIKMTIRVNLIVFSRILLSPYSGVSGSEVLGVHSRGDESLLGAFFGIVLQVGEQLGLTNRVSEDGDKRVEGFLEEETYS